ncbi:DNA polymerase III subunit delta [Buchnera aphidicola (Aphis glycines)]|uniref:DNA polymerase III subunit delta n=1 Tax=Buchnera aphidicola (Aphis glycines) TaxID=1265350 RepID=A0A0M4HIR8_9GAMM|nr:DNA polymerase III subunit delta [Buchnera aphidicola]ALD15377.1 DNA polymerase III subunit delta [Buchnera aphidicola (Aphis glycines)]
MVCNYEIYTHRRIKKKIIKKLNFFYILLGEDLILLNNNEKIIFHFAKKEHFKENYIINVKENTDWNQVINFYNSNDLFIKKKILVINLTTKNFNSVLIQNIKKLFFIKNIDILTIIKFNQLSKNFTKYLSTRNKVFNTHVIWCFTPYGTNFINWLKYEIQEKKIEMTKNAFLLLCKNYEGNTLSIYHVLNMITLTWKNQNITSQKIQYIINEFSVFTPSDWINAIFYNQIDKAFYILDIFRKQKYNPLILIRSLQQDLLQLIYIKREKITNIDSILKQNKIFFNRLKFFKFAIKSINFSNFLKVIRILLQIEIKIKEEYNFDIWVELKTLILLLSLNIQKN